MNKLLTFIFIFLSLGVKVFSQTTENIIFIKDADTGLPVSDVVVYISRTRESYLSNEEGIVKALYDGTTNLQFSNSAYKTYTIRSTTLEKENFLVFIKKNITNLDEIIITRKHPQKILKSLVENSKKSLATNVRLRVYIREFFKVDGEYSAYNDGLINFQLLENNKNFKCDVAVEQNRSYGLDLGDLSSDVLGYNLNDIMENYYNFKYLNPIISSESRKEYEFVVKAYSKNEKYLTMLISPIDKLKGLYDEVEIIYDPDEKLIIEINSSLSPLTMSKIKDKTTVGAKNIYKSNYKTIFRNDGSNYYLLSTKEEIGFEKVEKNKVVDIEVKNYFVTTNFSHKLLELESDDIFDDKTLYRKKNSILTNYWENSGLASTKEEQEIIEKLQLRE